MSELIQATTDRLATFIKENYTDVETGPGSVISELLIKLAAVLQNEQYNTIQTIDQGNTLYKVANSSNTKTYSSAMDLVASNYNTTRNTGTKVTGKIKVTVTEADTYSFNEGFIFIQPALSLNYVLTKDVRISLKPSAILEELQMYSDNGMYYFLLDVEAENEGPDYQVSSGTAFVLTPKEFISNLVKLEAYGNFSSGKAVETDKELLAKIKYNLGNSRLESPAGIFKKFSSTFSGFQSLSVCGANDAEMTRAKKNVLGISTFGKADVYVRSSVGPEIKHLTDKQAVQTGADTWTMSIANYEIPGFYSITAIIPQSTTLNLGGTLVFTPPVYTKAMYPGERYNEIYTNADARFTKYQEATVSFKYSPPPDSVGSKQLFTVHATYQPNIMEMQNMLLLDEERLACADYLVKAVVPCMVSLNITLIKKRTTDTYESLNLQQLKKDIFTYVNTIPFGEELHASRLVDLCHNYDIKRVDLPIEMVGNVLCPDGTTLYITDTDMLTIPYSLEKGVTPKTTQYFIDYYRVENGQTNPIDNIGLTIA